MTKDDDVPECVPDRIREWWQVVNGLTIAITLVAASQMPSEDFVEVRAPFSPANRDLKPEGGIGGQIRQDFAG